MSEPKRVVEGAVSTENRKGWGWENMTGGGITLEDVLGLVTGG